MGPELHRSITISTVNLLPESWKGHFFPGNLDAGGSVVLDRDNQCGLAGQPERVKVTKV
jgi:hypothetical protein